MAEDEANADDPEDDDLNAYMTWFPRLRWVGSGRVGSGWVGLGRVGYPFIFPGIG